MPTFLVNWKTTFIALVPLIGYALKFAGLWPDAIPLPPMDQIWPTLLAVFGIGFYAADAKN